MPALDRPFDMADSQYDLFRDLDRRCTVGDVTLEHCLEAARKKRAIIDGELNQTNPLVREVIAGKATFTDIYREFSQGLRGFRRFLPLPHHRAQNERLEHLAQIIPNVDHFKRRSLLAADNPSTTAVYAVIASFALGFIWNAANRDTTPTESAGIADEGHVQILVAALFGFAGFGLGLYAMLRYRTRDNKRIHAGEAAQYMDLNYECYGRLDDAAWAEFMHAKHQPPTARHATSQSTPIPAPGS